jgi:hypothetical protein
LCASGASQPDVVVAPVVEVDDAAGAEVDVVDVLGALLTFCVLGAGWLGAPSVHGTGFHGSGCVLV